MTTNQFFNTTGYTPTQDLIDSLKIEAIQMYGQDMYYIVRTENDVDTLYGEDTLNIFKIKYQIEMYVETIENFDGENEFMSKFGFELNDKSEFLVNATRFTEETGKEKPDEGDLVYWPLANKLFQITKVDHDDDFYELGKNYNHKLSLELFTYNQEELDTDIVAIDSLEEINFEDVSSEESSYSDNKVLEDSLNENDLEINDN
jgi:hypothetical protein